MEVLNTNNEIFTVQKEWFRPGKSKINDPEIFVQSGILLAALVVFQKDIADLIKIFPNIFSQASRADILIVAKGTFFIALILLYLFILYDFFVRKSEILPSSKKYVFDQENNALNESKSTGNRLICSLSEISEIVLLIEIEGKIMDSNPDGLGINIPNEWSLANSIYKVNISLSSGKELTLEKNSIPIFSKLETQDEFRDLISKTNKAVELIRSFLNSESVKDPECNDSERDEWIDLSSQRLKGACEEDEEEYSIQLIKETNPEFKSAL